MAKRKTKVVRVKKAVAVPEAVPEITVKEPGKTNKLLQLVLLLFVVFTITEVYFVSMNSIRQSKRPVYVSSFPVLYKGYTSAGVYGDYLYVNDNSQGDVYKTNKLNGVLEKVLSFPEGTFGAVADLAGNIYVLTKTNEVLVVDGKTYKTIEKIKPEGVTRAAWIDIDSKDNFFIVDSSTNEIVKYDHDFKKMLKFGGQGDATGSLNAVGKIYIGPKDNIYALNTNKPGSMEIKVYDNNGKFMDSWLIQKIKDFNSLTGMAIANDGNVYINSYNENMIFVFCSKGKLLGKFDSDTNKKFKIVNGAVLVVGGKDGLIYVFASQIAVLKTINY